jgi:AraC-like DNA-binding protein
LSAAARKAAKGRAGDVVLLASGKEHALADQPSTPAVTFRLSDTGHRGWLGHQHLAGAGTILLSGAYRLDPLVPHPLLATLPDLVYLPSRRRPGLHAAVDLLGTEVEQQEPGAEAIVSSLVDTLLVYILRAWLEAHPTGWSRALADPAIGPALDRVHRDPARPWTVEQLAAEAGLPRATFTRRFTALTGEPPLTYVTRWRLATAAQVLRQRDDPWPRSPAWSATPPSSRSPRRSSAITARLQAAFAVPPLPLTEQAPAPAPARAEFRALIIRRHWAAPRALVRIMRSWTCWGRRSRRRFRRAAASGA